MILIWKKRIYFAVLEVELSLSTRTLGQRTRRRPLSATATQSTEDNAGVLTQGATEAKPVPEF